MLALVSTYVEHLDYLGRPRALRTGTGESPGYSVHGRHRRRSRFRINI